MSIYFESDSFPKAWFTYDRKYIHISNDTYYRFHQSFNVYWQLVYYREFNEEFEVSAAGT